ncbi:hypothetical protein E2562_002020 [Oryza meyeriana var. granulata]|uniref:Uncharacterized protein n=1 Tax=Oryza meyeriana var. granulata TaxID=110450 RepID=A0A6G1C3J1_9ORYZ|nr:hypothetical protein E2562_002020 [Oryza meyeriana var. granulata]
MVAGTNDDEAFAVALPSVLGRRRSMAWWTGSVLEGGFGASPRWQGAMLLGGLRVRMGDAPRLVAA